MSAEEEVELELEALEAIYSTEFERVAHDGCRLVLKPNGDASHATAVLHVRFPPNYPFTTCDWTLDAKGLEKDVEDALMARLESTVAELVGAQQVYSLAEVVLEVLQQHDRPTLSNYDMMKAREEAAAEPSAGATGRESSDSEDAAGEPSGEGTTGEFAGFVEKDLPPAELRVTEKQFMEWKEQFCREMESSGVWPSREQNGEKLTGRQMFERGGSSLLEAAEPDASEFAIDDNLYLGDDEDVALSDVE